MLPFNLLSEKNIKSFVEVDRKDLDFREYSSEPFLDTYWN